MKRKIITCLGLVTLLVINSSCITNYYYVSLEEDTNMYSSFSTNSEVKTTLPKGTLIYLSPRVKRDNYYKIKWGHNSGWSYKPSYKSYSNYSSPSTKTTYSSGTVQVKGYYRKDGTYVKPHTRSAPKRKY